MRKVSMGRFLVLFGIFNMATNSVHPVTPTLLTNLHQPDYMFGMVFAAMSFTFFLTSPFWGRLSDSVGRVKVLGISSLGYVFGQIFFGLATNSVALVASRMVTGMFVGGFMVSSMAYVSDISTIENRGRYMAIFAAVTSVTAAAGFVAGGLIGDISVRAAFIFQGIVATLMAIGELVFLKDGIQTKERLTATDLLRSANPFRFFVEARNFCNLPMVLFLVMAFLASFATNGYDNAFNYYIKAALHFPPSYNGIIKAVVGITGLIANFSLNAYLNRKMRPQFSIIITMALCTLSQVLLVLCAGQVGLFVAANILFFIFNATYLPIQQTLATASIQDERYNGMAAGLFHSVRAIGMVLGPLFAGFIYGVNPLLPFIAVAVAFGLATLVNILNRNKYGVDIV